MRGEPLQSRGAAAAAAANKPRVHSGHKFRENRKCTGPTLERAIETSQSDLFSLFLLFFNLSWLIFLSFFFLFFSLLLSFFSSRFSDQFSVFLFFSFLVFLFFCVVVRVLPRRWE